jgi:tetraacyldisaccharide 4'-kinase
VALQSLEATAGKPLMAVAGIAQPDVFFTMLGQSGLSLAKTVSLPDHYSFDSYSRNDYEGYQLICTEKDAGKLWKVAPDAIAVPLVQTAEPQFWQALDGLLAERLAAKL